MDYRLVEMESMLHVFDGNVVRSQAAFCPDAHHDRDQKNASTESTKATC